MQDELRAILENPCVLTILNNMTEYVYIVDEQGCLQFINPAVEAFENLTNSEVKGKHIKELYTQGEILSFVCRKKIAGSMHSAA